MCLPHQVSLRTLHKLLVTKPVAGVCMRAEGVAHHTNPPVQELVMRAYCNIVDVLVIRSNAFAHPAVERRTPGM